MMKIPRRSKRVLLTTLIFIGGGLDLLATAAWSATGATAILLQTLPAADQVFAVVANDIDGDGRLDLLTTNRSQGTAQVLYQKTPRSFEAGPASKVLGFHPNGLSRLPGVAHRYVLSAEGDAALRVLEPDGQGGMRVVANRPQEGAFATTAFSWPGWGTSLAVAPYQGEELTILRNFQAETAQAETEYALRQPRHSVPGAVTVVDLNGDGVSELLYTTRRSRTLWRVNFPKDNQSPEAVAVWTAPVGAPRHLVIAEMTGDGAVDILLPLEPERRIAVLLNDGKGNFVPGPELPLPVPARAGGPKRLAVAEDRDGSLLLVASTEQSLVLYRIEKGDPYRYETVELPLDASVNQTLLLQDIDGDGEPDLVVGLSKVQDSLKILYGPLWKKLVNPQEAAQHEQTPLSASLESGMLADRAIVLADDPTRIVARVGEQNITLADFRQFVLQAGLGDELRTKAGQVKVLRKMIEDRLLRKAAEQERAASGPLAPEDYADALRKLENAHFPAPDLPEEAVLRAYYEANKEQFGIPEMVRLMQIQFRNDRDQPNAPAARQRAEQALQRLEAGEDFAKVATELTENPRAKETGPDRGFLPRNAEVWLREAVRGLQPGQRTGIVSSPVGYEILLVTDWRAPLLANFEAVRDKVADQWRAEQQQQARERYLKTLAGQLGVTVMEKGLENANPANQ